LIKIDILTCEHCGGALKVTDPAQPAQAAAVSEILTQKNLSRRGS
jgi:hypothetical protein